jgi:hypothetical protein
VEGAALQAAAGDPEEKQRFFAEWHAIGKLAQDAKPVLQKGDQGTGILPGHKYVDVVYTLQPYACDILLARCLKQKMTPTFTLLEPFRMAPSSTVYT